VTTDPAAPRQAAGGPPIEETGVAAPLVVATESRGDAIMLRVAGELDISTASEFLTVVGQALARGQSRLVVDLAALTFCDSTGLTAFVRGDRRCAEAGGWLRVTGARGHVARVFEISGVAEALAYRPS